MIQMLLVICIQDHTKVYWSNGGKCFKSNLPDLYIMKLMCVIYIYISIFLKKNGINTTSVLYIGSNKSFPILWGKFLKRILTALTIMKLTYAYASFAYT